MLSPFNGRQSHVRTAAAEGRHPAWHAPPRPLAWSLPLLILAETEDVRQDPEHYDDANDRFQRPTSLSPDVLAAAAG